MPLTPEQIEEIKKHAEIHTQAANDVNQNLATLWKSRLNMALTMNDDQLLKQALLLHPMMQSHFFDTNCGCGGGGSSLW